MLCVLLRNENIRSLTTVFFLSLALFHLTFTVGLLCVGFSAFIRDPHSLWEIGVFCLYCGFFSSTLLLMMMSFHRYLLVLHPLSDPGTVTMVAMESLSPSSPGLFLLSPQDRRSPGPGVEPSADMLFLNGILMFLEAAVGLVVNSVMVVILRKSETWRSLTNIFLLNLVLSHVILTLGLLCLGSPIFYFNPHIYDFLLKAGPFCLYCGFFSSTLLLMMMSFHRYLLVLHPLSDPGSHDGRHGITVSIITWTDRFQNTPEKQNTATQRKKKRKTCSLNSARSGRSPSAGTAAEMLTVQAKLMVVVTPSF
ncbi:hypothetical protein AGOR_G00032960 [Albula goreensis]|uniref:G-protein coupled receptors family 1 profile domain-containing protein n=1 Tax=Albula goreensis TaxID=1534307 RepID=A0A8T3E120_9TELE|nr:hypothetical protein AGOR_G00032960 [Albula goreensis]